MNDSHRDKLQRLNQVMLAGFAAIALSLIFWSVLRAGSLLQRDDNPRLVEAELRIQRGQIVDRNGVVLAENGGTLARQERLYPLAEAGAALGYYSFRHGTAGVEERFDTLLRGEPDNALIRWSNQLFHLPQRGHDVQLTVDAAWQETAVSLLTDHQTALLLLELPTTTSDPALVRTLVSQPSFDPNALDDIFDSLVEDETAPLLNRVTQGQYQPGLLLQPFLVAAAVEDGLIRLSDITDNPNRPVPVGNQITRCTTRPPESATWANVVTHRCPGPMLDLADRLGVGGLDQIFTNFGLTITPTLALNTETAVSDPTADPLLAGIGQENLTVTPLQLGLATAALGNNGRLPPLQLVTHTRSPNGAWQPITIENSTKSAVAAFTAQDIREIWLQHNNILEYSRLVLSGPDGSTNSWYLALTPANQPRYALVIVLENSDNLQEVEKIGREFLEVISGQ
ncbi:MAG: penicillin-binding transpeptidase domain-containing protein [Chloroflexota bacterium]